jgi:geranylgeranyl diphosphate synthase, type I
MIETLSRHREEIARLLAKIIDGSARHLDRVTPWAPDLRGRLLEFATRGKLVRGSLLAVGATTFGHTPDSDTYQVAAAIELIQSFLLIHDDIMDEDATRRGTPSLHEQYRLLGVDSSFTTPGRFGESMGICAGDVAMMLAVEAVSTTGLDAALRIELIRCIAAEIGDVGAAQMADVANGHRTDRASESEILWIYKWKTGRYTFSLPLSLGARIAGATQSQADDLGRWGEVQGTIFQIRDDQLELMENGDDTGKPAGSDIATDKQTLHRLRLFKAAPGTRWESVLPYFGSPVSAVQIAEVREALIGLGVLDGIDELVERLDLESIAVLDQMDSITEEAKAALLEIARFNRGRRQ